MELYQLLHRAFFKYIGGSKKSFNLVGEVWETISNFRINVMHSNQDDQKQTYEFVKETNFIVKEVGEKKQQR